MLLLSQRLFGGEREKEEDFCAFLYFSFQGFYLDKLEVKFSRFYLDNFGKKVLKRLLFRTLEKELI